MNRSYHLPSARVRQSVRRVLLGGALLVTVTAGLLAPPTALGQGCATTEGLVAHAGLSQTARQIVLIEGKDPANVPGDDACAFVPVSQIAHAIALTEGRDPANVSVASTGPSGSTTSSPYINGRGQVAYAETERSLAENALPDSVAAPADSPRASHTGF